MNNLKYYDNTLAYDFNRFMPREKQAVEENIIKMPSKAKKRAPRAISASAASVLMAAFMVVAVCGSIFLRVQITETSSKINDIKEEINVLDAEITKLNVEFENIISYTNLEQSASEIGMKKMDKSQVVYMRVNSSDAALTGNGEKLLSKE